MPRASLGLLAKSSAHGSHLLFADATGDVPVYGRINAGGSNSFVSKTIPGKVFTAGLLAAYSFGFAATNNRRSDTPGPHPLTRR